MIHGDNDYALSRLRVRIDQRLDSEGWRQVSGARSLAAVLERIAAGRAASWIADIGSHSEVHAIEGQLRLRFQALVAQLANWADPRWHGALMWCARLLQLATLRQCREFTRADQHDWSAQELRPFAGVDIDLPASVEAAWLAELMRRLPPLDADDRDELATLKRIVTQHRQRFSRLAPGNGWPERSLLERQLLTRLRRNPLSPVQLLTAVALALLDYERVRGELLRLAALPEELR